MGKRWQELCEDPKYYLVLEVKPPSDLRFKPSGLSGLNDSQKKC